MEIKIWYHSMKNIDCENHIKELAVFTNMPKDIAIDSKILDRVAIRSNGIIVFTNDMPARIDFDKYLGTIHILNNDEASYCCKPYSVLPEEKQAVTLWEYGERELANIEEDCLLSV